MRNLFFILICIAMLKPAVSQALPAQVIVVRHGEKDPASRELTQQGQERAAALAYLLTQTDFLLNYGPPAAIFASRQVPRSDRLKPRTIETMMPTAELLQLPIHSPFNGYQVNEIANFVLNSPKYDGQNIVICWNHSSIHDLLNAFGYQSPFICQNATNKKYPDCRYDLIFVMTFPAPQAPSGIPDPFKPNLPFATLFAQQLLFGDITCPVAGDVNCPFGPCPVSPPNYPPTLPAAQCSCTITSVPSCNDLVCTPPCSTVGLGEE